MIFADIRTWLCRVDEGVKQMVCWDTLGKGKIGKYTVFPPLWTDAFVFTVLHLDGLFTVWCNELFPSLSNPSTPSQIENETVVEENAFFGGKKLRKKKTFLHVLLPLYVLCHRATLSICSLKKRRCCPPCNAQTIELDHMHEHWTSKLCKFYIDIVLEVG